MQSISIELIIRTLIVECYTRRNMFFILFTIISFAFLTAGIMWPKKYTAFTIIHIDETNIIQPLMRGAAETTMTTDHVANAKEIIFGEKIMDQLLVETKLLTSETSNIEKAKIKEKIKENLKIRGVGENLLRIEYVHENQTLAYLTSKVLADIFIEAGENSKVEESQSAYSFINSQVQEYLAKLIKIENDLRVFRSNNPDSRPGLENEVSNRISSLQKDIEDTILLLRESEIKKESIQEQLSGEAAITISQSKEAQIREQMADLQTQLELLRLDYKETYPDIIRLKAQIEDLKISLSNEFNKRKLVNKLSKSTGESYTDDSIILSPLYQQLRSNLSTTETEIATLRTRIRVLNDNLNNEYGRAKNIYSGEEKLSQLTRNYQVNQDIYQDLLRRLESARVSKNLDQMQKGYTFKIQEPSRVPLIPTGIRFIHFVLAGILAGIVLPIGLIYVIIQLDPRVRFTQIITNELDIPVLAEIYKINSPSDRQNIKKNLILLLIGVIIVLSVFSYFTWLRITGQM